LTLGAMEAGLRFQVQGSRLLWDRFKGSRRGRCAVPSAASEAPDGVRDAELEVGGFRRRLIARLRMNFGEK
jgi:hypothetical protein